MIINFQKKKNLFFPSVKQFSIIHKLLKIHLGILYHLGQIKKISVFRVMGLTI